MKILVCFKVTPDYEALREADWAAGPDGEPDTRFVQRILNCFDESALELALRLSGTLAVQGVTASLGALSIGGREAESYLKTLLALGYGRAARVETDAPLDFAPALVASLIAGYAGRVDRSDLLLLGCRSGPGDSGTVPFLVAEALEWPCVPQVTEVSPAGADRVRVTCTAGDRLLHATVRLPCVLAVGNAVVSRLRVPTLRDRLAHKTLSVDVVGAADLGIDVAAALDGETCFLTALEPISRARQGIVIAGETPRDKARVLFDSCLKSVVEGL
jgi:electron transfer flavoprotein alpha/beta subunit